MGACFWAGRWGRQSGARPSRISIRCATPDGADALWFAKPVRHFACSFARWAPPPAQLAIMVVGYAGPFNAQPAGPRCYATTACRPGPAYPAARNPIGGLKHSRMGAGAADLWAWRPVDAGRGHLGDDDCVDGGTNGYLGRVALGLGQLCAAAGNEPMYDDADAWLARAGDDHCGLFSGDAMELHHPKPQPAAALGDAAP